MIVERWGEQSQEKVSWDLRYETFVKKAFNLKGDMMRKVRLKGTRPPWIDEDVWDDLQTYWKSDVFLKLPSQNKANQSLARGRIVQTSCCKAHVDVELELTQELQRDVRPDELFLKTHKRKNGKWADHRVESTYTTFKEKNWR